VSSVEFIRRFQADYEGAITYLVENFRSTQNIIAAANHVIQRAANRMKVDHPIRIDLRRAADPPGGRWATLDPEQKGSVRLVTSPADPNRQAQVVFEEIARIRRCDPEVSLGDIAVLARTHRSLEPLRALCDLEGLRNEVLTRDGAGAQISLMHSREGWRAADLLRARRSELLPIAALRRWLARQRSRQPRNRYWVDVDTAVAEFADAASASKLPAAEILDALYEAASEAKRSGNADALKLLTAHGAKGLEFQHVIVMDCADWKWSGEDERRLLYVAMTRAKETLTVMRAEGGRNPYLVDLGTVGEVIDLLPALRPNVRQEIDQHYLALGPADVDIGFAGRHAAGHVIHEHIAMLTPGDDIVVDNRHLKSRRGEIVGRLASKTRIDVDGPVMGTLAGVLVRTREQTYPEYQLAVKVDRWESLLVELIVPAAGQVPAVQVGSSDPDQ
jgi:ATP-dependent DNA helicase RecQ